MVDWPSSLPQSPLLSSFSEQTQDTRIRTSFDSGPPQVRRRFTLALRYFKASFFMTEAQISTLDAFIQTTLNGGVSSFSWKHPRTGVDITTRFVGIPTYDAYSKSSSGVIYKVDCSFEVIP